MDKITEIRERYKLETGILPHKDALNYADYLEEYIVKTCNAPAVSVVREPKASGAVCPKCGCNKITGDGSKNWCLNSECDFVEAN